MATVSKDLHGPVYKAGWDGFHDLLTAGENPYKQFAGNVDAHYWAAGWQDAMWAAVCRLQPEAKVVSHNGVPVLEGTRAMDVGDGPAEVITTIAMPDHPDLDYAWAIAMHYSGVPHYWYGGTGTSFGPDADQAVRFARIEDGQRVATRLLSSQCVTVVKRGWAR